MDSPQELLKRRNKLAKLLNNRMLNLEKHGINYGAIQEYKDYIEKNYSGKTRLKENIKSREQLPKGMSLKGEVFKLENILSMKTSSYRGVKQIENKRLKTFEQRYGIKFKNGEELKDFVNSEYYEQLTKMYGSKSAVRLISASKYDTQEISDRLEKFREKTGRDIPSSSQLLRTLGFRNKSAALEALAEVL